MVTKLGKAAAALALLGSVAVGGWVLRHYWTTPLWNEYRNSFAAIHVEDGIDEHEAETLARVYLDEFISGCGAPMPPKASGGSWVSQLKLGVAGQLSAETIRVDARTGAISSSEGRPRFSSLAAFRREVLWGL